MQHLPKCDSYQASQPGVLAGVGSFHCGTRPSKQINTHKKKHKRTRVRPPRAQALITTLQKLQSRDTAAEQALVVALSAAVCTVPGGPDARRQVE